MAKSKVTIKINNAGISEMRTSAGVRADLVRRGEAVAAAAGDGFKVMESASSKTRARVRIQTDTLETRIAVARDAGTLTRALDAAR